MSAGAQPSQHPGADNGLFRRLWIYQAERFPIGKTSFLLLVFSAASISVSAHLAGRPLPATWTFVAVWLAVIVVFFQMRACDEYKDLEDDRHYRPERPIPSGLVTLRLVLGLAGMGAVAAILLTVSVDFWLLLPLLFVWMWLGLMTVEFFASEWLKARRVLYLVSHMAIMTLICLYITAAEWLPYGWPPPKGLWLFVCMSFFNGCVIELGRKIWAPENERPGVETYSDLLGPAPAARLWAAACVVAWCLLAGVGVVIGAPWLVAAPGLVMLVIVVWVASAFIRHPTPKRQRLVDDLSGLWVFVCYCLAGFAPFLASVLT